jgi:hypothetical protein
MFIKNDKNKYFAKKFSKLKFTSVSYGSHIENDVSTDKFAVGGNLFDVNPNNARF